MRILVVDDDPILREFASVHLSSPCTTIETMSDGAAARARLAEASYDMLLLDIDMPRLDGFALLQQIRSDIRLIHLPVIMLTGRDDIASIDRAYQLGADSFATKPVNWRQLSYQIRYVARMSRGDGHQGSHARSHESVSGRAAVTTQREVGDFLQSVIERSSALEAQLTAEDRLRCSEPLQGIRYYAKRAVTDLSVQAESAGVAAPMMHTPYRAKA